MRIAARAALAPFDKVADLLSELLSVSGTPNAGTVRSRTMRVGEAVGEHANLWGSLHYRCGRLVTVRRMEAGIPRAESSLEYATLRGIVMDPTSLHAL